MSILCDIGNTNAHFLIDKDLVSLPFKEIYRYKDKEVYYISVNKRLDLSGFEKWVNLEEFVKVKGAYEGMGVDRRAVCMAIDYGVVVDAGSAITVDVVKDGVYEGGFIYPGLRALKKAFASISSLLDVDFKKVDITLLPKDTAFGISYGVFAPLICAIKKFDMPIYLTGGDADILKEYLPYAMVDKKLIFKGIKKAKDIYVNSCSSKR